MIKRFYWCVACGYHGDFKRPKKRAIKCESCGYDDIISIEEKEYDETTEAQRTKLTNFRRLNVSKKDG